MRFEEKKKKNKPLEFIPVLFVVCNSKAIIYKKHGDKNQQIHWEEDPFMTVKQYGPVVTAERDGFLQ